MWKTSTQNVDRRMKDKEEEAYRQRGGKMMKYRERREVQGDSRTSRCEMLGTSRCGMMRPMIRADQTPENMPQN
jgi:hypothetical protein